MINLTTAYMYTAIMGKGSIKIIIILVTTNKNNRKMFNKRPHCRELIRVTPFEIRGYLNAGLCSNTELSEWRLLKVLR